MKIGVISVIFGDKTLDEIVGVCRDLGVEGLELGTGNWSANKHLDVDRMLADAAARKSLLRLLEKNGIGLAALNCSGNPLAPGEWGRREDAVTRKTLRLAGLLGVEMVVLMSGLPGGGPADAFPNWVVTSWPPETLAMQEYQWSVAIPYWQNLVKKAEKHGVRRLALEPHGWQLVHNVENFRRLRDATDATVGFNLDPSHLFWMGADPLQVARALGDAVYHVHVKDTRLEAPAGINTVMDGKASPDYRGRSWNFCIPGYGHDEHWWRQFMVTLRMIGYDGNLSIEHEDHSMELMTGIRKTVELLHAVMI